MSNIKELLESENTRKAFLSSGIVFPILFTIIYLVLDIIRPDYNPLIHMISELGVIGTSTALLASISFIINGIMLILFALGLYLSIRGEKGAFIGPFLMISDGAFDWIGSGIFPMDPTLIPVTFSGVMHLVVSIIGLWVMLLAPFFIARSFKENKPQMYKLTLIFGILIFVAIGLFLSFTLINNLIGLFQRITIGIYFIWIFILGIMLFKGKEN